MLLTGTVPHLAAIERQLLSADVDTGAAERNGQLVLSDVEESLVHVVTDGRLEPARFGEVACGALEGVLADSRFAGVRWWGEMTSTLHHRHGNREAGLEAERLADAAAKKYGAKVFCSFLCDKFDAHGYDSTLKDLCCVHSHVIPASDYVRHRLAVNRAIAEVVGDIRGTLLQSLTSWKGLGCDLPSSQAMLFWLREALPEHFEAVLKRAKTYEAEKPA